MPCRSDYLEPNAREIESQRVAKLLSYAFHALSMRVPVRVEAASADIYGNRDLCDAFTIQLCGLCKAMTEAEQTRIIYNAKSKDARALADWWEEHQAADAKREAEERAEAKRAKIAAAALAKLSTTEREALGL